MIARHLYGVPMPQPPNCVGTYEPEHTTCNGDQDGVTEQERMPCAWRNRCVGLQQFCAETHQPAELVVATLDYEQFVTLCENRIELDEIVDGVPQKHLAEQTGDSGSGVDLAELPRKSTRSSRSKAKVRSPRKKQPLAEDILLLGAHFEQCLRDEFPNGRFARNGKVVARPGTFYAVDRTRASHYVSWYCTRAKGPDQAIACVRFKPRLKQVDLALPVEADALKTLLKPRTLRELSPRTSVVGQFQTVCKHLDREGIGLAVSAIRRMADRELIAVS